MTKWWNLTWNIHAIALRKSDRKGGRRHAPVWRAGKNEWSVFAGRNLVSEIPVNAEKRDPCFTIERMPVYNLAGKLTKYAHRKDCIILAVPRGCSRGFCCSSEPRLPLDVILAKDQPPDEPGIRDRGSKLIWLLCGASWRCYGKLYHRRTPKVRIRLKEMEERFIGNRPVINPENKTVILIDDGIATGNTLLATVRLIRKRNPAKLVIAVPVASYSAAEKLSAECDEFVCLLIPDMFGA